MISLDPQARQKLIKIIASIPEMQSERGRRQILEQAGLSEFIPRIDLTGATGIVVGEIVTVLVNYGCNEKRQVVLAVWLDTIKSYVGSQHQLFFNELLSVIHQEAFSRIDPSQGQPTKSLITEPIITPKEARPLLEPLTRRKSLKLALLTLTGTGLAVVAQNVFFSAKKSSLPLKELPLPPAGVKLKNFDFQVVMLNALGQKVERIQGQAQFFIEDLDNGVNLEMIAIPGGTFLMGTEDEQIERLSKKFNSEGFKREEPQHFVTVKPFFMGKFPVTQAQWRAIANLPKVERELNSAPSDFKGDNLPVEQVSWYDADEFCKRLSRKTGLLYKLPSEAEWEYACRAGTSTLFHFGETISTELANYYVRETYDKAVKGEYREQTTPVGYFKVANTFGLYDMHGNVWEWCEDDFYSNYQGAPTDGQAWLSENILSKVIRGATWAEYSYNCRSAFRLGYPRSERVNYLGMRVVLVAPRTT